MNKEYILYNLKEAREALETLINDLETDLEYDQGSYFIDIQHIYTTLTLRGIREILQKNKALNALKKILKNGDNFQRTYTWADDRN